MLRNLVTLSLLAGMFASPAIEAQTDKASAREASPQATTVAVPKDVENFSGMLIGRLVSRDVERGEFTVTIDYVPRIWENNKSRNPRALVGKTVTVEGVAGKFLDSLLLIRPGETMEFEANHRGGDRLRFPGEWLRKVPPFDPQNYPAPPEAFRGFAGVVVGKIDSKIDESGEFVIRIAEIEQSAPNSRAEKAESAIGKQILVAGFWGKKRKPFDELKVGEMVRAGLIHRVAQSDHLSVTELIEKAEDKKTPGQKTEAK